MRLPRTTAFFPPDQPSRLVEFDIICTACGYNVRGMMQHDRCPECGNKVMPSIARSWQLRANAKWIKVIVAGGISMIAAAVLATIATALKRSAGQMEAYALAILMLSYLAAGVSIWLITTPQPGRQEPKFLRYVIRIGACIVTLIAIVGIAATVRSAAADVDEVFIGISYFGTAGLTFAYYWHISELARRFRWFGLRILMRVVAVALTLNTLFSVAYVGDVLDFRNGTMPTPGLGAVAAVATVFRFRNARLTNGGEIGLWAAQVICQVAAIALLVLLCIRVGDLFGIEKPESAQPQHA